MSFESKLNKFIKKLYKKYSFVDRKGKLTKFNLADKVEFSVQDVDLRDYPVSKWRAEIYMKLKFDNLKAAENYHLFSKYKSQINIDVHAYDKYDTWQTYLTEEPQPLFKVKDSFCHIGCSETDLEIQRDIGAFYLTHDIVMYDNLFDNLLIHKLLEHGFNITHSYNVDKKCTIYNEVSLKPYQLKTFFEEVCEKIDSVKNDPLYEEYKKYVIDEFANNAVHYSREKQDYYYELDAYEPMITAYDFETWKSKVYEPAQDKIRKEEIAKSYIAQIETRIKEQHPTYRKAE